MWNAISEFIGELVDIFYHKDDDVSRDHELQSWVKDIHENGLPTREGDEDHGFPENIQSRKQLGHVLSCIVFTCTCQHAAVNFSQMDVTAFVPNVPTVMRVPPPTRKNEANMKMIMDTLPSKYQAGWHIATMYALTRIAEDEVKARLKLTEILKATHVQISHKQWEKSRPNEKSTLISFSWVFRYNDI